MNSPTNLALKSPWTRQETPVVGTARTNSSLCRSCQTYIDAGDVRIGLVFNHLNGFICLDWHHLTCCISPENLQATADYDQLLESEKDQVQSWIEQLQSPIFTK